MLPLCPSLSAPLFLPLSFSFIPSLACLPPLSSVIYALRPSCSRVSRCFACLEIIDNIIRNAHKLRSLRNEMGMKWNRVEWNRVQSAGTASLPLDSCSFERLIAMIQLQVPRPLPVSFSLSLSLSLSLLVLVLSPALIRCKLGTHTPGARKGWGDLCCIIRSTVRDNCYTIVPIQLPPVYCSLSSGLSCIYNSSKLL